MSPGLRFMLLLCGLSFGNVLCSGRRYHCTPDLCVICPAGWYLGEIHCYQFVGAEKNWSDAEQFCISLDAHLASIEKPWDYNSIQAVIYGASGPKPRTWVGGTAASNESGWRWSDGSKFTFTAWGPREPNNLGGEENCMEINLNGKDYVNAENCNRTNPFVCAKDAKTVYIRTSNTSDTT